MYPCRARLRSSNAHTGHETESTDPSRWARAGPTSNSSYVIHTSPQPAISIQCASMLSRGFRSDSPARAGAGDGAAARFRSTARVCVTVGTLVWFGNTVTRCGPNVILHGYTSTTSATASLNFRLNSFSSESLPNCR